MKKKIHLNIIILSGLVALLVTGFLLVVFYDFHVKNEIQALKEYGNIISEIELDSIRENIDPNTRLTTLDLYGNVLSDNMANPENMENHLNRPEIKDALEYGQGEAVRNSATLEKDTYYYAILLSDDSIFRISRQGATIFSHFANILPFIFLIVFLILLLSFFTSSLLSKKIIKPVENMVDNIEGLKDDKKLEEFIIYDEIMPFIKKVENQEKQIKYNTENLEEKAALMNVITSSMVEGLILLDRNKKILSANDSGVKLLQGDSKQNYQGEYLTRLSRNIQLYEALDESIVSNSSQEIMLKANKKHINTYINPVVNNNNLVGLVILLVDFTEKYKNDLMRREFSANVSHELKTPLTSINGYAEMIESGLAKDKDIKKFASTIRAEGSRLLGLIDSIIKISKIEEGQYDKKLTNVDVCAIGKNTIESLKFIANEKNIDLKINAKATFIKGNKSMIEELIYNLIDNGIKYTPYGGSVGLEIKTYQGWAFIKVSDTGIGIPENEQARIYERFYTVDKSRSNKTSSTGLGLSIVKHIVEEHKGEIILKSEINKGTEISIKIRADE